jgi:hypothetical protein
MIIGGLVFGQFKLFAVLDKSESEHHLLDMVQRMGEWMADVGMSSPK